MTVPTAQQIDLSLTDDFSAGFSEEWLTQVLRLAVARAFPPDTAGQISLLLTDDDALRELNRTYRGLDETTDVLSFSPHHSGQWYGDTDPPPALAAALNGSPAAPWLDFILPPEALPPLGEVIISCPQAQRQAAAAQRPLAQELAWLIIHGALHLAGYDHLQPAETAQMQAQEQAALAALFPPPEVV